MDDEEIERLAEAFLAQVPGYVWDGRSLPVPIEEIADTHAGLLVRDVEDLAAAPGAPQLQDGQTLSGLLLPALGEIWVNAAESRRWPARRRFTIAHELGHWRLHRDAGEGAFCRAAAIQAPGLVPEPIGLVPEPDADPNPGADPGPDLSPDPEPPPIEEQQANQFAAAVLMPAPLIRERYLAMGDDLQLLCRTFASSGAAMRRRLEAIIGPTAGRPGT